MFKVGDEIFAEFRDSDGNIVKLKSVISQIHQDGSFLCANEETGWFDYFTESQLRKFNEGVDSMDNKKDCKKDCNGVKEFFSEWQRMCNSYSGKNNSGQCPFHTPINNGCASCFALESVRISGEKLEQLVRIVQEWSDKHPVEIDWTKVPPNTPVLVRDNVASVWIERYFVAYLPKRAGDKFAVFNNCILCKPVSQEEATGMDYFCECKLADGVDQTPYLKEVVKSDN